MKKLSILIVACLIFTGCITSQPSKFYILTPTKYNNDSVNSQSPPLPILKNKNITVGVGPVSIAKYLDRSQLVVRLSSNQIRLEDFHQWAGSPRDDIPAILLENISSVIEINRVYKYPWQSHAKIDYQIVVDIIQLDGRPDSNVRLVARWEIMKSGREVIKSQKADFTEPVDNNQFDSFVAAQSRAIGHLSLMIAKSLIELI
ncbi:MAG: membrane integrity-associated transporter subunit PqiC [Desulfamplus sp.]|nr:membrane integrity-associated transporter subunit PqiC [Desulfamplus sp.]